MYGTLAVPDSLRSMRTASGIIADYGEERVWEQIDRFFRAHNEITSAMLDMLCETSTRRLGSVGGVATMQMEEVAEYGRVQAQKNMTGDVMGWPLRKFGQGLQWTSDYMKITPLSELSKQVTQIFTSDLRNIQKRIKTAMTRSTNYTFYDRMIDGYGLPVKALANADSFPIPVGPSGTQFDASTHTHYLAATAAWSGATTAQKTADVLALINTVAEHVDVEGIEVAINSNDEANFRLLTGFVAFTDPDITPSDNTDRPIQRLDMWNKTNRVIGKFNGAVIAVRPYGVQNYPMAYSVGNAAGGNKPLRIRVRGTGEKGDEGPVRSILGNSGAGNEASFGDLRLVVDVDHYPLRAKAYEREFDVAVNNRTAAAILYIAGTSYVIPTIT